MARWKARAVFLCLLLLFFGQLAFGARHLSLTADEPAHITRGYVYLTTNDFWMVPVLGHPPLVEAWAASPLLLNADRPRPTEVPHWRENTALYIQSLLPRLGTVDQIEIVTRVPVMLLAALLMALTFRWTSDIAGGWCGVCAAALMAWDPTMIAHAQLDTTDLGVTLLVFACAYTFWKLARRPSLGRLVAIGLLTGLAMAAKHSGLLALLLMGLLVVWGWVRAVAGGDTTEAQPTSAARSMARRSAEVPSTSASTDAPIYRGRPRRVLAEAWRWGGRGIAILLLSVLVLWAIYRFETERLTVFPWIVPFPSHIGSLRALFESRERFAFLRGRLREGGWWWYSPYVFLIKTPLPFIAAILFSVYDGVRRGTQAWLRDVPLWLFPVLYWGITMAGGVHLGYRHLLPILPFLYVWVGRAVGRAFSRSSADGGAFTGSTDAASARVAFRRSRIGRWVMVGLSAWYVLGTCRVYPYSLAYFNELVGGPSNGYRHVVDSNVDWGHGFKALAQTMREEGISDVSLSYWTWVDPALYGVEYTPLPPAPETEAEMERFPAFAPPVGTYAISATTLQGILLRDTDLYEWFRHQQPIAQPGYGLLMYQVERAEPAPSWVGQCTTPAPPLSPSHIDRGFGGQVQRVAYFDCTQAWLYPDGGETAGWYVLHQDALDEASEWIDPRLSSLASQTPPRRAQSPIAVWTAEPPIAVWTAEPPIAVWTAEPNARLSYAHPRPGTLPPFRIYEWTPRRVEGGATDQSTKADLESSVSVPSDAGNPPLFAGRSLSTPVSFDGPLTLRGYRISAIEEHTLELQTWWEVKASCDEASDSCADGEAPDSCADGEAPRLFSLMAHALDSEGNAIGVADGLGVPLSEMRPGDWLVQRHRFTLDARGGVVTAPDELWLETGGYWLDTMERWPVLEDGEAIGDRVILTSVKLCGR